MTEVKDMQSFFELDTLCMNLLGEFFDWLRESGGMTDEEADPVAHAADRFLRDFAADIMVTPPQELSPDTVRCYLGNWYIVNTLTPTLEQVDLIGRSIALLLEFLEERFILAPQLSKPAIEEAVKVDFFKERLERFWRLTPEDTDKWMGECDYRKVKGAVQ